MNDEQLENERKHLKAAFCKNGYRDKIIDVGLQRAMRTNNYREEGQTD